MICPNCNFDQNPEGFKYCGMCGTKLPQPIICPNPECACSNMPIGSRFCPDCGTKLILPLNTTPIVTINVNGISFDMIRVEGGSFYMGSHQNQNRGSQYDEKPLHEIEVSSFYIAETQVTQELWKSIMNENPSRPMHEKHPVERVSWDECQTFIQKLNVITEKEFRLPTEAEWEYAARGGNKSKEYKYSGSDDVKSVARYLVTNEGYTSECKTKQPNELGIYDMSGNVWEWCQDWYGSYCLTPRTNPQGPIDGTRRVCRGGSCDEYAECCRTSARNSHKPNQRKIHVGIRLACTII